MPVFLRFIDCIHVHLVTHVGLSLLGPNQLVNQVGLDYDIMNCPTVLVLVVVELVSSENLLSTSLLFRDL